MLSLGIVGKALVLPQSNVLDFVDFPWEASSFLRSGVGGKVEGKEEGRKWKLGMICKDEERQF